MFYAISKRDIKWLGYKASFKCSKVLKLLAIALPVISIVEITAQNVAHAFMDDWTMTTYFGEVDEVHKTPHQGIDFAVRENTPVNTILDGKVVAVLDEGNRSWGKSVHILDAQGRTLIYGHLNDIQVTEGQQVHFGDTVALTGNTGNSTGSHLHVEVRINGKQIDPMPIIQSATIRTAFQGR